jgi:hypothetical protein
MSGKQERAGCNKWIASGAFFRFVITALAVGVFHFNGKKRSEHPQMRTGRHQEMPYSYNSFETHPLAVSPYEVHPEQITAL